MSEDIKYLKKILKKLEGDTIKEKYSFLKSSFENYESVMDRNWRLSEKLSGLIKNNHLVIEKISDSIYKIIFNNIEHDWEYIRLIVLDEDNINIELDFIYKDRIEVKYLGKSQLLLDVMNYLKEYK